MGAEAALATRAGRRAAAGPRRAAAGPRRTRRPHGSWSLPLALLAVLLLGAGALLGTALRPVERVVAAVPDTGGVPLVVLTPALLASGGGPVEVRARGAGTVLLARGSADDVAAWVSGTASAAATELDEGGEVVLRRTGGAAQAPDPSGSDLWAGQASGRGSAALDLEAPAASGAGAQAVLVASDGTAPAPAVQLTFRRRGAPVLAGSLLAAGALTAVAALTAGLRRRRRTGGAP